MQRGEAERALPVLRRPGVSQELWYKFAPTLMLLAPAQTVDAWMTAQPPLDPPRYACSLWLLSPSLSVSLLPLSLLTLPLSSLPPPCHAPSLLRHCCSRFLCTHHHPTPWPKLPPFLVMTHPCRTPAASLICLYSQSLCTCSATASRSAFASPSNSCMLTHQLFHLNKPSCMEEAVVLACMTFQHVLEV